MSAFMENYLLIALSVLGVLVLLTVRLAMLKARRRKRLVTRLSTPGWLRTRMAMV